eukprot:maker-scaffold_6-snap-gene-6.10-mRNA-1 protein AED:0.02 eAED:0.02 QI:28/1/1/1/1/1/4/55/725
MKIIGKSFLGNILQGKHTKKISAALHYLRYDQPKKNTFKPQIPPKSFSIMTQDPIDIEGLRAEVTKQGSVVREMKKSGANAETLTPEIEKLKNLKISLQAEEKKLKPLEFDRATFESVLLRRMLVVPAFEIYGAEKGLFDLGPEGSRLLDNISTIWKKHFVITDNLLQLTATCLTPERVLEASGHVQRFTDLMVKDEQTGSCFRADKLLEDHIDRVIDAKSAGKDVVKINPKGFEVEELLKIKNQADAYTPKELDEQLKDFGITSPETGGSLSPSFPFNLMFKTAIGPEGNKIGYLRPETAQGIFVNFKRLLERSGGKMPFGVAQLGNGFRNEISPRGGLVRVREFPMAEIEFFVNPENKDHRKFDKIINVEATLFPRENQVGDGKMLKKNIGAAIDEHLLQNQTVAYFIARTQQFLLKIGIDGKKIRFRQHLKTQMAHYAQDCWDAEIMINGQWVECVGIADRSCYDLKNHSESTGVPLVATNRLDEPRIDQVIEPQFDKRAIGKTFKKNAQKLIAEIEKKCEGNNFAPLEIFSLEVDGEEFEITSEMVTFKTVEKKVFSETYYPHVIEPSFGMGRILSAVLEHAFYKRNEDEDIKDGVVRTVFKFLPVVAPVKCAVFPLQNKPAYIEKVNQITEALQEEGEISVESDTSSVSIGKRYARMDEIGVPFALTVDEDTLNGKGITLRERDSTKQIRIDESVLLETLEKLCKGRTVFDQLVEKYGTI